MKNHFTVLILLYPVLQRELKLLIAVPVSPRWLFDDAPVTHFSRMVVAALAFLVWDILITTDEEVTLFSGLIPVALEFRS